MVRNVVFMTKSGRSITAMIVTRAKIEGAMRLVASVTITYARQEILILDKNSLDLALWA